MKTLFYSIKNFELSYLKSHIPKDQEVNFCKDSLSAKTTHLANGYDAISIFAGDNCSGDVIRSLKNEGVKFIAIRSAGYDNVDLPAAEHAGIRVANVPEYSPYAIAEHAVAMILALNRRLIKADKQVHKQNFTVDNLVGFDLNKKKIGIIGTGKIGSIFAKIMNGFGCTILAYDSHPNSELENKYSAFYTGLNTICSMCDIISIHLPLNDDTRYIIDSKLISTMKKGVMIINTSRGAVVKTSDVLAGLKTGNTGYYGMDVYENESGLFFYDHTAEDLNDPMLQQLLNHPDVLITPHQAFATREALTNIAVTTFNNLTEYKMRQPLTNEVTTAHNATVPVVQS